MTHDMRRQALESRKTVSKKAQAKLSGSTLATASPAKSKQGSRVASTRNTPAASRHASRAPSRANSDDEAEDAFSDNTANSLDDLLAIGEEDEDLVDDLAQELDATIESLLDRNWKRSSVQSRETALNQYTRILTARFSKDAISGKELELMNSFLKSVKSETSEKETLYALKALGITIITSQEEDIYEPVSSALRRTITDSSSINIKTAAIQALGITAFYGDISDEELLDNLSFFLEIVSSDGGYIDAHDHAAPVVAALENWGFLATLVDDLSAETEDAMEAFVDQLSSGFTSVAIAAGQNIALLYEKSYTPPEEDEQFSGSEDGKDIIKDDINEKKVAYVKRYDVYRRRDQLEDILSDLATISTRGISKKDKRDLHSNFSDILNSVRNPTQGPGFRSALDEDGRRYGSSMTVKIGHGGVMSINKWWKYLTLKGMTRILQGGFPTHYEHNEVIFGALPVLTHKK